MGKLRVGMLTSGGDCPGLNATIRGAAKAIYEAFGEDKVEIIGIHDGYHGLIHGVYKSMQPSDFSGILTQGGTILGTKRTPFKMMQIIEDDKVDKVKEMKDTYKDLKLDCLFTLGGNGTHKTANMLSEQGLNVIGLPKTIDNDIFGTDVTFGFHAAVDIGTEVIDRIHTTEFPQPRYGYRDHGQQGGLADALQRTCRRRRHHSSAGDTVRYQQGSAGMPEAR